MPQIEILKGRNPANPLCAYIAELLAIEGYTFRFVDEPSSPRELLIVPNLLLTDAQKEIIREHARQGGSLVALRPPLDLAGVFGLHALGDQLFSAYTRHCDGEILQVHGGTDRYRLAGAEVVAPLLRDYDEERSAAFPSASSEPAVARAEQAGGRQVCFAYDLARCCVLIQQGRADQASDGAFANADGDWKFSQNDMFVGHLDPRLRNVPQSDLHRDLLVRMIIWATEPTAPIPRIWRFPDAEPAAAMIDGDGDLAGRDLFDLAFSTCEEFGFPYSTYLMTDQFETITPSDARALRAEGHSVGFHPWLGPYPTLAEFETYLKAAFGAFIERYGYTPSASRNHCIIWTGWVDLPRVEAELGVRIDLNGYPGRYFQSGALSGTLLPVKFMDASGALIDVYSQYTIITDDGWVESKNFLPALTESERIKETRRWIDRCIEHQGMFHPTFHPIRLRDMGESTLPWFRETLSCLRERRVRGWSADGWATFNDARRTVQIEPIQTGWLVRSTRSIQGATLLFSREPAGVQLRWNGKPIGTKTFRTAGRDHVAVVVDLDGKQPGKLERA